MTRILLSGMLVLSSFLIGAGCEYGERRERGDRDRGRYYERYDRGMDRDRDSGYYQERAYPEERR
jgi:hypothetical protein